MYRISSVVATTVLALVMVAAAVGAGGRSAPAFELAASSLSRGAWPGLGVATTRFDGAGNPIIRIAAAAGAAARTSKTKPPRMSRRQVGQTALAIMADKARQLGRSLAKPRFSSITFVKPGETYSGGSHNFRWWSVHAQGTFMSCGATTCGLASRGTIAIADATGCETGGRLDGHITIIPVDQVKLRRGPLCQRVPSPANP
jgi:hypothetical protein